MSSSDNKDEKDLTSLGEYSRKLQEQSVEPKGSTSEEGTQSPPDAPPPLPTDEFAPFSEQAGEPPQRALESSYEAPREHTGDTKDLSLNITGIPGLDPAPVDEPLIEPSKEFGTTGATATTGTQTQVGTMPGDDFGGEQTGLTKTMRPEDALTEVRQYAEKVSAPKINVPAAYPFSLIITGALAPEEKERLLDILSRENLGITEVDLEPQFAAGKVLIPRISEFAGVMIVQALRATRARMRLGPSDSIFATDDTRSDEPMVNPDEGGKKLSLALDHPAESLPVTAGESIPEISAFKVIDVISASASIRSTAIEAESSTEYLELLEALQRELKYKAYHKGAIGILNYSVQLTSLDLPSHYRVLVSGTAIKTQN